MPRSPALTWLSTLEAATEMVKAYEVAPERRREAKRKRDPFGGHCGRAGQRQNDRDKNRRGNGKMGQRLQKRARDKNVERPDDRIAQQPPVRLQRRHQRRR